MVLFVLFCALVAGCRTVPGGKAGMKPVLETKTEADGTLVGILRPRSDSRTYLYGPLSVDGAGNRVLSVEKLHWFNNWHEGWTEADFSASGTLTLPPLTDSAPMTLTGTVTVAYAISGTIRYRDTIVYGEQATALLNRRLERIKSVTAYLLTVPGASDADFEKTAGRILFPEIYGYPKGKSKSGRGKANWRSGEGFLWDAGYSGRAFPRELQDVRNSGTLYRDWEETEPLFNFTYKGAY
jgi:hypothetical protein